MPLDFLHSQSATAPNRVASGLQKPSESDASNFQQGLQTAINPQVDESRSDTTTSVETSMSEPPKAATLDRTVAASSPDHTGEPHSMTDESDIPSTTPITPATATDEAISSEQQIPAPFDAAIGELDPQSTDSTQNSSAVNLVLALSANGKSVRVDWAEPEAIGQQGIMPWHEPFSSLPSMPSGPMRSSANPLNGYSVPSPDEQLLQATNNKSSTAARDVGTMIPGAMTLTPSAFDGLLAATSELNHQSTDNIGAFAPPATTTSPTNGVDKQSVLVRLIAIERASPEQAQLVTDISSPETAFTPLPSMCRANAGSPSGTTTQTSSSQPAASMSTAAVLDSMVIASKSNVAAISSSLQQMTDPSQDSLPGRFHTNSAIPSAALSAVSPLTQSPETNSVLAINNDQAAPDRLSLPAAIDVTQITTTQRIVTHAETRIELTFHEQQVTERQDHSNVQQPLMPRDDGSLDMLVDEVAAMLPHPSIARDLDAEHASPQQPEHSNTRPPQSVPSILQRADAGTMTPSTTPRPHTSEKVPGDQQPNIKLPDAPGTDVLSFALPSVAGTALVADLANGTVSAQLDDQPIGSSLAQTEFGAEDVALNTVSHAPTANALNMSSSTQLSALHLDTDSSAVRGNHTEPTATVRQVIGAMQQAVESNERLRVHLNPPELGTVMVEVSRTQHGIVAKIEFSNASTQQTVANSLPELHRTLSQTGIVMDRVEVTIRDQRPESPERQPREERGRQQQSFSQQQNQERQQRQQRRFIEEELDREAA